MFDIHKRKVSPSLTPTHSRTNSVNSLEPLKLPYFRTRKRQPDKSFSRLSHKSRIQKSKYLHPHESRNIDLYMPNCQLDPKQYASILSLISIRKKHDSSDIGLKDLMNPEFAVLQYTINKLILETSHFCRINFPGKIVRKMATLFADNYHLVAYHNYSHAFSVLLLNFQCLQQSFKLKYLFTQQEYFYIMVAGLAHDINHPGTNNIYENKMKSNLAKHYNGQSVLQNMHINHLWAILRQHPEYDFLAASTNRQRAKNIITRLILNTDMSLHNKNLDKLKKLTFNNEFDPKRNYEHKWLLMEQIFHACDIGNSCSEYNNYLSWNALLVCQFTQQVQLQQKNGLEVTKFLIFKDHSDIYRDQLWFVGNLVQPLWKQIGAICPDLGYLQHIISDNLSRIKQELDNIDK